MQAVRCCFQSHMFVLHDCMTVEQQLLEKRAKLALRRLDTIPELGAPSVKTQNEPKRKKTS